MISESKKSGVRLVRGAGVLTAVALLAKIIGALYKIPLTRILGSRGMGVYQSVFPSYALLVTLSGGGITSAVSKLTAERDGDFDVGAATVITLCLSLPLTLVSLFLSRAVATFSGALEGAAAFAILVLSVPLSSVCAVLKGYFQGLGRASKSAVGQLVEQSAKLAAGLVLSYALSYVSLAASVAGCAAGVTLSEAAALAYYAIAKSRAHGREKAPAESAESAATENIEKAFFGIEALTEASSELAPSPESLTAADTPRRGERKRTALGKTLRAVFSVAFPITLGLAVLPLCQVADSFTVVNLLRRGGAARETATALYGLVTGPVSALANMPAVFTVGVSATLLPKISACVSRREKIDGTVKKIAAVSFFAGLIFCLSLAIAAPVVLKILYGGSLAALFDTAVALLRISSAAVPAIAVMQTASAVLQGGGKAYVPAVCLFVAALVKEGLNLLLIPVTGVTGFVIATVVFYALAAAGDTAAMLIYLRGYEKRRLENSGISDCNTGA